MLETDPFKFTVQRLALLEVLRGMQCILDKKAEQDSSLIRMSIEQSGSLLMTVSDGAIFIEAKIHVEVADFKQEHSELYLPVGILYDLTRRLEVTQLDFIVSEKNVKLTYTDGDFSLAKVNSVANYIRSSELEVPTFKLHSQNLLDTLRMLKATMAMDDIRDQFKGISVVIRGGEMVLWSTDGVKMCIAKTAIDADFEIQGIWPRKFIDTLCTITSDSVAEFQMSGRQVRCKIGETVIFSPLINAKLLDYNSVFNQNMQFSIKLTCDPHYLQKKLDRMMILDSDGSVLFEINDNPSISCTNKQKSDKAFEKLDQINCEGESGEFYVNPSIMINFMRNFKNSVEILFYKSNNTIIVKKKGEDYPIYITKAMIIRKV